MSTTRSEGGSNDLTEPPWCGSTRGLAGLAQAYQFIVKQEASRYLSRFTSKRKNPIRQQEKKKRRRHNGEEGVFEQRREIELRGRYGTEILDWISQ